MLDLAHALLWIVVGLQGLFICFLVRELSELRSRGLLPGLPVGSEAPAFSGIDVQSGEPVESTLFKGQRVAVLFVTAECGDCRRLVSQLARMGPASLSGLIVYCYGSPRRCQANMLKLVGAVRVLRNDQMDIATTFGLRGVPALVAIDEQWRIAAYRYPHQATDVQILLNRPDEARDTEMASHRSVPDLKLPMEELATRL